MSTLKFRPRYKFLSPLPSEELIQLLQQFKAGAEYNDLAMRLSRRQVTLLHKKPDFFSPQMDITFETDPEINGTVVRCMIAPSPSAFTMFMFCYALFGIAAVFGFSLGLSQLTLNHQAWGMWIAALGTLCFTSMYGLSWYGQQLHKTTMYRMKHYVDEALGCDCIALAEKLEQQK